MDGTCEYYPAIEVSVPSGEYIKIADSFTVDAFPLTCEKSAMINTIENDSLDCPGESAYVIIDCWDGGHIPTPDGVFPIEEVYRIDPYLNGFKR